MEVFSTRYYNYKRRKKIAVDWRSLRILALC